MINPHEPVFSVELPDGLTLRSVSKPEELERVAVFNGLIHGAGVVGFTANLFAAHPDTRGRDLLYVENEMGEVIASACLIPWTLHAGEVNLPTGELGIVGTREDYRGRGINRHLMGAFWQRFEERGCLLSIIQGIPYFYRQYGYQYAHLPLEGGWRLQPDQVPAPLNEGYTFHPATPEDAMLLAALYEAQAGCLDISARRSADIWRYLLSDLRKPDDMEHETLLVNSPQGRPAGYLRLPKCHFYENLVTVDECSEMSFEAGLAVLNLLANRARAAGQDGIRLNLPATSSLLKLARAYGAASLGSYSWQVRVPDMAALLTRLGPVFSARLSGSAFAGLTRKIGLDFYRHCIELEFSGGALKSAVLVKHGAEPILRIPPEQAVPLVLGGCTLAEIGESYPDARAEHLWKPLVEVLFPKTRAYLATIY
jgi:GNAT superfamily N-acetyltransferase